MPPRRITAPALALSFTLGLALFGGFAAAQEGSPPLAPQDSGALGPTDPVLVAAGDIACDPKNPSFRHGNGTSTHCRQEAVADLIGTLSPDVVMPLGDTQYDHGKRRAYKRSYHPSWGRYRSDTLAVVGNHEYETRDARGYFGYFKDAAGPTSRGYYATDIGDWRIIVLNSNCAFESCDPGGRQVKWLRRQLDNHPSDCTLAAWHHPRWSSGLHGDDPSSTAFLRQLGPAGVDVILNGHDHHYERFRPRAPNGDAEADGFTQFIVGTGGAELYPIGRSAPKSEVTRKAFGVLSLTLHTGSYDWDFERLESGAGDQGSATCT